MHVSSAPHVPWPLHEFGQAACAVVAARARRASFIVGLRRGVREGRPLSPEKAAPALLCVCAAARPLKRGLRAHALAHVALAAARPFVDGMGLYPAATACAPAWAATLLAYGVLLDGVRRC